MSRGANAFVEAIQTFLPELCCKSVLAGVADVSVASQAKSSVVEAAGSDANADWMIEPLGEQILRVGQILYTQADRHMAEVAKKNIVHRS